MQIPVELLEKWKKLRSRGDNEKINALLEKPMTEEMAIAVIGRALNRKSCPDHIFKALNRFYSQKEVDLYGEK